MTWWRDEAEFRERWERFGWNLSAVADAENVNVGTLQRWKNKHGLAVPSHVDKHHSVRRDRGTHLPQPPPLVPITSEELRIEGDAACSSDWHVPIIDYEILNRFLEDSERAGLSSGIIAGDLFNLDALSDYDPKQKGAGLEAELEHASYAVGLALQVFDRLIVTLGNHDERLPKRLQFKLRFEKALRMLLSDLPKEDLDRITITDRDYVIVETDRGEWRICHTRNYSRIPLAYPAKLAMRFHQHVAGGHRHHHAQGFAANGCSIVELGGLFDVKRTGYLHRWSNDFPRWQPGYGLLRDGRMLCPMLG